MALFSNLHSCIRRKILAEARTSVRFYCEAAENVGEEQKQIDPLKDRTKIIPTETSIRYMQSKAYNQSYGDKPVWALYKRNHKGGLAPRKTRKTCVRNGIISTGNPCPICRDEYLILDHRNTKLLEQFISEHTGQDETILCPLQGFKLSPYQISSKLVQQFKHEEVTDGHTRIYNISMDGFDLTHCRTYKFFGSFCILDAFKTGLCQKKHKELLVAIERAWDQGNLTYDVPFREYDYSLYYKKQNTQ